MKKEKTKQKNFRLPVSLVEELEKVSEIVTESQTDIVISGARARVRMLKKRIQQKQQAEVAVA